MSVRVPYVDLAAQHRAIEERLLAATARVLRHAQFVNGPEVLELEAKIAAYVGVKHAIAVGNGTDSMHLPMRFLGIGPGDEVVTTPNSFIASAAAIELVGAKTVFVDVGNDHNVDPDAFARAITPRTKAILVVHLRGRPAQMGAVLEIAKAKNVLVLEDAAQAIGAKLGATMVGAFGAFGSFSFHPLKNLAACGDAGIVTTNDSRLAEWLVKARSHGLRDRDHSEFFSFNSRLDTLQAALLLEKLPLLDEWNAKRRATAAYYRAELGHLVDAPDERPGEHAVYHTFVIETDQRDLLQRFLAERGVDTKVHYPTPIHLEDAAKHLGHRAGAFPVVERQASRILSLPIFPELTDEQKGAVVASVRAFFQREAR
jgi:dTDP-4-amino-4,6-dideoxygalactose transaminase